MVAVTKLRLLAVDSVVKASDPPRTGMFRVAKSPLEEPKLKTLNASAADRLHEQLVFGKPVLEDILNATPEPTAGEPDHSELVGWFDEALAQATLFKDYVKNQNGYGLINRAGRPFSQEAKVQIFFGFAVV